MRVSEGRMRIDCSVGAIVWVRRRNGSWWPGRILGSDELSVSHLMSPRSGTPVKLLGREDASVDWYNLEKSKRVKAFRCGEFDDCIERAESSLGIHVKKREKYARREDAILHALELEREHIGKKEQQPGIGINCMSNNSNSENFLANVKARDGCRFRNLKSHTFCRRTDSSLEEEGMAQLLYSKPSYDNENSETIPRMRGLQDFGLRISSKEKLSSSVACVSNGDPILPDSHLYAPSDVVNNSNSMDSALAVRRKRSQGSLLEEALVKRRDRRRPLVQVLQCSTKLPLLKPLKSDHDEISNAMLVEKEQMSVLCEEEGKKCVYLPFNSNNYLVHEGFPSNQMRMSPRFGMDTSLLHPGSITEEYTSSGLIEAQESDSSEWNYLDHDTEDTRALPSDPVESGNGYCSVYQDPVLGNMDGDEFDESELCSHMSQHLPDEQLTGITSDMGGSKWQLKGKRNIRNLTKKHMEAVDIKDSTEKNFNEAILEYCEGKENKQIENPIKQRLFVQQNPCMSKNLYSKYDESDLIENDMGQTCILHYENENVGKYASTLKPLSIYRGDMINNNISSDEDSYLFPSMWDVDRLSQATLRGYQQESDECFFPVYAGSFGARTRSILVDVDLKVQASYQGERVPLVSLMSRLNGKAIVGHPVQVEKMEDGSSNLLICRDDFCEELNDTDGNTDLPPVWRTARRTVMHRIPRPPSAQEREDASMLQYSDSDHERTNPFDKIFAVKNKAKTMRGKFPHCSRPLVHKKFSKKLMKRNSLSNQKTRTLSSIAIEQKHSGKNHLHTSADKSEGLYCSVKPVGLVRVVACVPVKLVFSRIQESIGRP